MASIHQFKSYLQDIKKDREITGLLYNYITAFYPLSGQTFRAPIIENFYFQTLHNLRQRAVHKSLGADLLNEIQPFFRKNFMNQEFLELKNILSSQLVSIEDEKETLSVLEFWYKGQASSGEKISAVPTENQFIVLKIKLDGSLEVKTHSRVFYLKKGQLHPLPHLSWLRYGRDFELKQLRPQTIFAPPSTFFQFEMNRHQTVCTAYQMEDFSKIESQSYKNIKENKELFFNLKKIENYFIKPKSDPLYRDLIQSLQSAYQMLLSNHPQAVHEAKKAMENSRVAISNFYTHDRLLILLTANIEFRLKTKAEVASSVLLGNVSKDPFIRSALSHETSRSS